jgi:hypothetical protein
MRFLSKNMVLEGLPVSKGIGDAFVYALYEPKAAVDSLVALLDTGLNET